MAALVEKRRRHGQRVQSAVTAAWRRGGGAVGEEDRSQLRRMTGGAIVEASKDEG